MMIVGAAKNKEMAKYIRKSISFSRPIPISQLIKVGGDLKNILKNADKKKDGEIIPIQFEYRTAGFNKKDVSFPCLYFVVKKIKGNFLITGIEESISAKIKDSLTE